MGSLSFLLLALTIASVLGDQCVPSTFPQSGQDFFLKYFNDKRAGEGQSKLTWDDDLAQVAEGIMDECLWHERTAPDCSGNGKLGVVGLHVDGGDASTFASDEDTMTEQLHRIYDESKTYFDMGRENDSDGTGYRYAMLGSSEVSKIGCAFPTQGQCDDRDMWIYCVVNKYISY